MEIIVLIVGVLCFLIGFGCGAIYNAPTPAEMLDAYHRQETPE